MSVSDDDDAYDVPVEYTTFVDADSFVFHEREAVVVATDVVARSLIIGAVRSAVVNDHVVLADIPSK